MNSTLGLLLSLAVTSQYGDGDVSTVGTSSGKSVPCAKDFRAYVEMLKSVKSGDKEGLDQLEAGKRIFLVAPGTQVRVIEHNPSSKNLRERGLEEYSMEVRILDGPDKGASGFMHPWLAEKPFASPVPVEKKAAKKATPAPPSPADRAASKLQVSKNLEKSGKLPAAVAGYEEIVKDFGATPAAREAATRLKALKK